MEKAYVDTVRLLLEVAPVVFQEAPFVIKGGTAINLFLDDMPRLSVDIDVVYSNREHSRDVALQSISTNLKKIKSTLEQRGMQVALVSTSANDDIKLLVTRGEVLVKIEVNHVFRGTVLPVVDQRLREQARNSFATDLIVPALAPAELYGSKLVAALDRQHPRDFFDVGRMYQAGGLTPEIVECFVSYLAGHNRPIHEVLFSNDQDIKAAFENEFDGMTREPITLNELVEVRRKLRAELPSAITLNQKKFLISLASAEPDWSLMKCRHLAELPAIRWKLQNLDKLKKFNPSKFAQQADELRARWSV